MAVPSARELRLGEGQRDAEGRLGCGVQDHAAEAGGGQGRQLAQELLALVGVDAARGRVEPARARRGRARATPLALAASYQPPGAEPAVDLRHARMDRAVAGGGAGVLAAMVAQVIELGRHNG